MNYFRQKQAMCGTRTVQGSAIVQGEQEKQIRTGNAQKMILNIEAECAMCVIGLPEDFSVFLSGKMYPLGDATSHLE